MAIIWGGLAARVGHGKQRRLMAFGAEKSHSLEQVDLGPAKRIVIFVAKQDPHGEDSNPGLRTAGMRSVAGTGRQSESGFSCG